jgi:hypothetical protein
MLLLVVLFNISCKQFGGKIAFIDDEYTQMRENSRNGGDWNAMYDAYYEKWTINGLNLFINIAAHHTVFSSKDPYVIAFFLHRTENAKKNYMQFTIKDVKINGTSNKDYQLLADKNFPITFLLDNSDFSRGKYVTDNVFQFSFEKLAITFTIEVETIDSIESKTFEYHVSSVHNPPEPIWEYMWR